MAPVCFTGLTQPFVCCLQNLTLADAYFGRGDLILQQRERIKQNTINERRRHKNRPPVEHGDAPLINTTNMPLARLFETPPAPAATTTAAQQPPAR